MKPLLHLLLFALTISLSLAQESRVLVQNAKTTSQGSPVVNIKWYNQQFVYKKGVNVYRREAGTAPWIKLNAAPIVMPKSVPPALLQRHEELEGFLDMAEGMVDLVFEGAEKREIDNIHFHFLPHRSQRASNVLSPEDYLYGSLINYAVLPLKDRGDRYLISSCSKSGSLKTVFMIGTSLADAQSGAGRLAPDVGFLIHNKQLGGQIDNFGVPKGCPPRCAHCWFLSDGVKIIGND